MKTVSHMAAQGDVLFRRVETPPAYLAQQPPRRPLIVARSESGHHHAIFDDGVRSFEGLLILYLVIDGAYADVVHLRPFDTHETLRLGQGVWEVRRQREWSPHGGRLVID